MTSRAGDDVDLVVSRAEHVFGTKAFSGIIDIDFSAALGRTGEVILEASFSGVKVSDASEASGVEVSKAFECAFMYF